MHVTENPQIRATSEESVFHLHALKQPRGRQSGAGWIAPGCHQEPRLLSLCPNTISVNSFHVAARAPAIISVFQVAQRGEKMGRDRHPHAL